MPVLALASAALAAAVEQFVEWHYGAVGLAGLILLTVGLKARNTTCSCVGAVVLALLLAH